MIYLSQILEKWAELYKPLSHDPKKDSKAKAYYNIRTINNDSEFVRNQNTAKSPCMAYSVLIDAQSTHAQNVSYAHTVYFLSRTVARSLAKNAKQSDDMGMDHNELMDSMVRALLAYLRQLKHTGKCPITGTPLDEPTRRAVMGLDLDKAEWASLPVKYAEWNVMALQIEQNIQCSPCINPEDYNVKQ